MTASPPPSGAPRRVRVTRPPTGRPRSTTMASEIDAGSSVGEVYIRSLMRAQLRLAVRTVAVLVLILGSLPLIFAVFPAVRRADLLGVPLPWILLGGLVYPFLWVLGMTYARRADRHEALFSELVGEHGGGHSNGHGSERLPPGAS